MEYLIAFTIAVVANLFILWLRKLRWTLPPADFGGGQPRRIYFIILLQFILNFSLNIAVFISVLLAELSLWWLVIVPISFLIVSILMWKQLNEVILYLWHKLNRFESIGVIDCDQEIGNGMNYHYALVACKDELRFLGIGASKLTSDSEFINTVTRCRPEKAIQLLLLNPTDIRLVRAAQRFGREREEYRRIVVSSLRTIADIKNSRAFNMEVRFYDIEPIFRLMFIDNSICLVSYYVLGEGDGSQLPQLHLLRATEAVSCSSSFYRAFELYFDDLWERSQSWDFMQHLE